MKTALSILVLFAACHVVRESEQTDSIDGGDTPLSCGDTVCDPTRGSTCVDGDTLRTYMTSCENDLCVYLPTDVECGVLGCCGNHCCTVSPWRTHAFD